MTSDRNPPIDRTSLEQLITQTFVDSAEHHTALTSTNDRGLTLARSQTDRPPGSVHLIYAEQQSRGRGRKGKSWLSAPGSLTFSLLIPRPKAISTVVSLAVAVATSEACAECVPEETIRVKWPNDIYLNGRKAGGILIESPANGSQLVIGIGINVNNSFANLELEDGEAITLAAASGKAIDRAHLFHGILSCLGKRWVNASMTLPADWDRWCLLRGKEIIVHLKHRTIKGICRGIDGAGNLLIEEATFDADSPNLHAVASAKSITWQ
jgi:BirA family biotin operon repressor/biotin-[acetyl-CoA-carboxylase] ligase